MLCRKRTDQRPKLKPDLSRIGGAAGLVLWIGGLCFGLATVPIGQSAAMFCAAAALTAFTARLILREPIPGLAWPVAALALLGAVLVGSQAWPVAVAGVGWGSHALLVRRGDPLDAHGAHLILAAPVAFLLMLDQPPLRDQALVLAALVALVVSLSALWWHRRVNFPALAPVAVLTALLGLMVGEGPGLALAVSGVAAFALQRMIGSNGS